MIASNTDGCLQVFALNAVDQCVLTSVQNEPGADSWSPVYRLINPDDTPVRGDITVAANGDGTLLAEVIATYGFTISQTAPNTGWQPQWAVLGAGRGQDAPAMLSPGITAPPSPRTETRGASRVAPG